MQSIKKNLQSAQSGATVGYQAELWRMADALRGGSDAAERQCVCLAPLFLHCIFAGTHRRLVRTTV